MKISSYLPISATTFVFALAAVTASAADWIFAPSTYSHDPESGQRVAQYAPIPPVYTAPRAGYVESGYRHFRSSIRGAYGSADHLHLVEEWGRPVRPYGEWQHPYRPGSVPYSLWGPPYAGMYNNWWGSPWWGPFRGGGRPGFGGGGPGGPGGGGPGGPGGGFPGGPGGGFPGGPGGGFPGGPGGP